MQLTEAHIVLALIAAFTSGLGVGWWIWSLRGTPVHNHKQVLSSDIFEDKGTLVAEARPVHKAFTPAPRREEDRDLTQIYGIDDETQRRLNALGIRYLYQVADWGPARIKHVEDKLGDTGRIAREKWVAQARQLRMRKRTSVPAEIDMATL